MVSVVITSCLDDDNNIEYSPDATIHAFELDTIGYGRTYKFTIDQLQGEIYNEDSLPVGADTIIDRILIKTLSTASSYVTILKKEPTVNGLYEDSVYLNTIDSIDLRNPLKIRVYSTEALAYGALDKSKIYTISVRVHEQDPDSMQWVKMDKKLPVPLNEQKAILAGNNIIVYTANSTHKVTIDPTTSIVSKTESLTHSFGELPASVVYFKGTYYATVKGKVYQSQDGETWNQELESSPLNNSGDVEIILAAFSDSLTAIVKNEAGEKHFAKSNGTTAWVEHDKVLEAFPKNHITSSLYESSTGVETAILVGTPNSENGYIVPWYSSIKDKNWFDMPTSAGTDTAYPSCPYIENPSVIHYNDAFYIFGGDFSAVHKSLNGIAWNAADKKFWLPEEFKDKGKYSMVVDTNNFIWILWNNGDIWRGRLNKLGFDKK